MPGVAENLKIISEKACRNIAHFAFKYAVENNRKKVTACHKAGIMYNFLSLFPLKIPLSFHSLIIIPLSLIITHIFP